MLIHKIFHLRQPVPEARKRLREAGTWNTSSNDFEVQGSRVQIAAPGQPVSAEIEEVPGDDPNRILFRSVGGTVELAGVIELYPIRPQLTEAVLTVEYHDASPLQKAIGTVSMALDRFLNQQLALLEGHAGSI
jgi:uncharacterized membrane protein